MTIDIVLYIFVVIELYRPIIAYAGAESVVKAVVHAGIIAVIRQIITFKPGNARNNRSGAYDLRSLRTSASRTIYQFFLVHRQDNLE